MKFTAVKQAELIEVAKVLVEQKSFSNLIVFYGEMGAGKTTLIKSIAKYCEVINSVSSPSFGLVNEYVTSQNQLLYHFDFYRIKNITEVYDIGYEDYFYSNNLCLIEWPEKIEEILAEETLIKVYISINNDNTRDISIEQFTP
jgi:tRNA threonylcarbamoyladenosine biosynthesis protein TsaE